MNKADKRRVVRLGRSVGLSRLKSIEFIRRAERAAMKCAICGELDVGGRWFTLGPGGLHSVGICESCGSSPTFASEVAAILAERYKTEPELGEEDGNG